MTRISSAGTYFAALYALQDAQAKLTKTQAQVASGRRVNSPADDPIAAVRILQVQGELAASGQYARNSALARDRLSLEERTVADVGSELDRIRELLLQAANSTVDDGARRMIATEVQGRLSQLVDLANKRDAGGEYLFAGLATHTQPFARTAGGVTYAGDQGERSQQVSSTQAVLDADSGDSVFMRLPAGNGTFVTGASATNTGSGQVTVGTVVDRAAWVPDTYTLRFATADTWEVVDSVATVVGSGTYVSGQAIDFRGVRVAISGTPVATDTFTVETSGTTDLFATLDAAAAALLQPVSSDVDRAQYNMAIARSIAEIDGAQEHLLAVRASVGTRLNTLDTLDSSRADTDLESERLLSGLRDLDYAEAVSRMEREMVGLQAAQQSFARLSQLSLFDYL
jgi:flagellar hook-associated protein 3 FlgL